MRETFVNRYGGRGGKYTFEPLFHIWKVSVFFEIRNVFVVPASAGSWSP